MNSKKLRKSVFGTPFPSIRLIFNPSLINRSLWNFFLGFWRFKWGLRSRWSYKKWSKASPRTRFSIHVLKCWTKKTILMDHCLSECINRKHVFGVDLVCLIKVKCHFKLWIHLLRITGCTSFSLYCSLLILSIFDRMTMGEGYIEPCYISPIRSISVACRSKQLLSRIKI